MTDEQAQTKAILPFLQVSTFRCCCFKCVLSFCTC